MKVLIMHEDRTIDAQSASPSLSGDNCHGTVKNAAWSGTVDRSATSILLGWIGRSTAGFTLIELIFVVVILMVLAAISFPVYSKVVDGVKVARTKQEIRVLETEIQGYFYENNAYPATLADINRAGLLDPWENNYKYRNIANPDGGALAERRRFADPLNTDFDLYSMGRDGLTEQQVNGGGGTGKDDVIRASNGAYNGRGDEF